MIQRPLIVNQANETCAREQELRERHRDASQREKEMEGDADACTTAQVAGRQSRRRSRQIAAGEGREKHGEKAWRRRQQQQEQEERRRRQRHKEGDGASEEAGKQGRKGGREAEVALERATPLRLPQPPPQAILVFTHTHAGANSVRQSVWSSL